MVVLAKEEERKTAYPLFTGKQLKIERAKGRVPTNYPDWDFDKHCTKQVPEYYTKEFFGHEGDKDFALTKPFTILTPEGVAIARSCVMSDPNFPRFCRYNEQEHR